MTPVHDMKMGLHCRLVLLHLPDEAKREGVKVRWWQPKHGGLNMDDWALDQVIVGGKRINPNEIRDGFSAGPKQYAWLEAVNVQYGEYCGSKGTATALSRGEEDVTLVTTDVDVREGFILQFSLSVGCREDSGKGLSPLYLEYSTDYGMHWALLEEGCLPFLPGCHGNTAVPSMYYQNRGWRRETFLLKGSVTSR